MVPDIDKLNQRQGSDGVPAHGNQDVEDKAYWAGSVYSGRINQGTGNGVEVLDEKKDTCCRGEKGNDDGKVCVGPAETVCNGMKQQFDGVEKPGSPLEEAGGRLVCDQVEQPEDQHLGWHHERYDNKNKDDFLASEFEIDQGKGSKKGKNDLSYRNIKGDYQGVFHVDPELVIEKGPLEIVKKACPYPHRGRENLLGILSRFYEREYDGKADENNRCNENEVNPYGIFFSFVHILTPDSGCLCPWMRTENRRRSPP